MLALPASVMAQVEEATVVRTPDDAKVMFTQKFEATGGLDADAAWEQWSTKAVDTLRQLTYINHVGSESNIAIYTDAAAEWNTTFVKDSLILMKNGVMTTDDAGDIAGGYYDADDYTLYFDNGEDQERNIAFAEYGEDGGKYYFQYTSGDAKGAANYSDGIVPNYRRNLFVRGLDVQDESSYRLTLYVKARAKGKTKPTFYADVMRGYFHSEKPFSMGYVANSSSDHPYEYNTTFEYKKEDFEFDKWEKVTFMTYYLNDSIADGFCYTAYWWAGGSEWSFRPSDDALAAAGVTLGANDSLKHVKQPDKFFVRLSFASDSTEFAVDNISLTKSWIGGVEYNDDMIRVDFGYQTNLKDLAVEAGKNSFVNAIELSGEYFEVLGYRARNQKWYKIDINSAEYHDDGYMYMWTKPTINGSQYIVNKFNVYDSVLVSFKNPDEKALRLNYTGSNFPMALNTDWIKDGKKVHDFSNEIATPNPNIGKGVYSMKNLPPVLTDLQYEKGSFHLDGDLNSVQFQFSRPVLIAPEEGASSKYALLIVEKDGVKEFWIPSAQEAGAEADSILTFTRQASDINKNGALDGDYSFTLANIQGFGTDYAKNTVIDYSFGQTVMADVAASIDFADYDDSDDYTTDVKTLGISGFSGDRCAAKIKSFSGAYEKGLMWGLYGVSTGAENNANNCCKLFFTFTADEPGSYSFSFGVTGCQKGSWNDDANMVVFIYDANGAEIAKNSYGGTGFKPDEGGQVDEVKDYAISANLAAGTYKLALTLPNEGSWGGGHKGGKILWYLNIESNFTLGYPYVKSLNDAIAGLDKSFEIVDADEYQYSGEAYEATKLVYDTYVDFYDTKPSRYTAVTDSLNKANIALKARFSVVDAMWASYSDLEAKLEAYGDSISDLDGVDYDQTEAYLSMDYYVSMYGGYECFDQTDDEINAVKAELDSVGKLMDDRRALTKDYFKSVENADNIVNDPNAATTIDEYANLQDELDNAFALFDDLATISDDNLSKAIADLNAAVNEYNAFIAASAATTVRVKSLARLAKKVNADFGDATDEIESRIEGLVFDDLKLADVLKSAIKVAIYKEIAENGELSDTLDLSGFIRNFNLYSTLTNDQVDKYYYQWGEPHDRWKAKAGESEDIFPGWKVNPNGGNVHIGNEATAWDDSKAPIFDAYLAMDWNAYVSMSQTVEDLPAGVYSIGVGFNVSVDAGNNKHTFSATTSDTVYSILAPTNIGSDTHPRPEEPNLWLDSVVVADGDNVTLGIKMANVNSWAMIDNFAIIMSEPYEGVDYEAAARNEQQVLEELISFVDSYEAAQVKVEYTTLDGILVPAPQPGQILIRIVTINGKSEASTVIIK
jgi:uncharacterized protein YfbU (UPF0304 family)